MLTLVEVEIDVEVDADVETLVLIDVDRLDVVHDDTLELSDVVVETLVLELEYVE